MEQEVSRIQTGNGAMGAMRTGLIMPHPNRDKMFML
jgi:hypothetical protein